jgi:hypothetical protein
MQSEEIITQYCLITPLREGIYFLFSVTLATKKKGYTIQAFLTNSDFNAIAPNSSILQSIS